MITFIIKTKIIWLLLFIVISNNCCSPLKHTVNDFNGEIYVDDRGMMGKTIIQFNQNMVNYSERDSMWVGTGNWRFTDNHKSIILRVRATSKQINSGSTYGYNPINLTLRIKGKNRLIGDNHHFERKIE